MNTPELTYAPAPPWYRRRWFHRLVILSLLLAAMLSLYFLLPAALLRARIYSALRECQSVSLPPTHIVYDTSPANVPLLLKSSPTYVAIGPGNAPSPTSSCASWSCTQWDQLDALLEGRSHWRRFPPILFCHMRTSADGTSRLVIVQYDNGREVFGSSIFIEEYYNFRVTLVPTTLVQIPRPTTWDVRAFRSDTIHTLSPITRIHAAQPDPADPARWTFDIETFTGPRQTIAMHLSPDATNIICENASAPSPPAPTATHPF